MERPHPSLEIVRELAMLAVALPLTLVGLALATVCFALGSVAVATIVLSPLALVFAGVVQASATAYCPCRRGGGADCPSDPARGVVAA